MSVTVSVVMVRWSDENCDEVCGCAHVWCYCLNTWTTKVNLTQMKAILKKKRFTSFVFRESFQ